MTLEKFIEMLNIGKRGNYADAHSYIIDIDSSDEYGKIFSKLDRNQDLEQEDDNTLLNIHSSSIIYTYDNKFQANLIADFDNDTYKLVISEFN